ncbi:hypothetical protein IWX90DRAFT_516432, partial [Phyllosticta citrichinensis]
MHHGRSFFFLSFVLIWLGGMDGGSLFVFPQLFALHRFIIIIIIIISLPWHGMGLVGLVGWTVGWADGTRLTTGSGSLVSTRFPLSYLSELIVVFERLQITKLTFSP